jgi:hypothetical protein
LKSGIDLKQLEASYQKKAIGPAKEYVLKSRMQVIPTAPLNLVESEKGCNHVAITWDNPTSDPQYITGYELVLVHEGQNDWKIVNLSKDTQPPAQVSNLAFNTWYDLRLRACNGRRKGEFSKLLKVKTNAGKPEKSEKPGIQLLEDHPTKAMLIAQRLSKEEQNGADIDKIAVGSSLETSNEWIWKNYSVSPGDEPIKTEIELPSAPMECKKIKYKIKMINIGGESEASEVVVLNTSELYPGEPRELSCLSCPEKREGIVSWSAPVINPSSASSYRLEYKKEHGTWVKHQVEDNDIASQTIPNLEPATVYHIRVRAYNSVHEGKWREAEFTTKAWKPNKPLGPTIETDPTNHEQVIMTVQRLPRNEENGSPVLKIVAEKCRGESEKWISKEYPLSDGNQKMKVKMDLDNAADVTTYYFRVRMKNDVGLSEASDVVELKTSELYPGPPDELKCISVPEKREGKITWSAPSINPSSALSYQLKCKKGESGTWTWCEIDEDKQQVVIKMEPATLYYVKVRALNSIHEGNWREAEFTTKAWKPNKPMKPTIETDPSNPLQVILTVQMLSKDDENGSSVSRIIAERSKEDLEEWVKLPEYQIADGKQDMRIKTDLENATKETTFYFRVAMKNDVGVGEPSDAVAIHSSKLYSGPPQSLDCSSCPEKAEAVVSWSAPTINPASVVSYQLQYMKGESHCGDWIQCQIDDTSTKRTIPNLERAALYYIRVSALNPSHEGKWKEERFTIKPWKPNKPIKPTIETDPVNHEQVIMTVQRPPKNEENGSPVLKIATEKCRGEFKEWVCKEYPLSDGNQKMKVKIDLDNAADVTTYYFRVRMKNDVGLSEASDVVELKTSELYPGPPDELNCQSVPEKREGIISWSTPSINPSSVM